MRLHESLVHNAALLYIYVNMLVLYLQNVMIVLFVSIFNIQCLFHFTDCLPPVEAPFLVASYAASPSSLCVPSSSLIPHTDAECKAFLHFTSSQGSILPSWWCLTEKEVSSRRKWVHPGVIKEVLSRAPLLLNNSLLQLLSYTYYHHTPSYTSSYSLKSTHNHFEASINYCCSLCNTLR